MKNTPLIIFIFLMIVNCNSQKLKETSVESKITFQDISDLKGNWYNIKTSTQKNNRTIDLTMQCPGKSFWEISESNGAYKLVKHFVSGQNCETHIIKTSGLSYKDGLLSYREDDIMKNEKIEKLGNTKYKISETGFANGQSFLIERFYEKR